jgi:hypothetical protein
MRWRRSELKFGWHVSASQRPAVRHRLRPVLPKNPAVTSSKVFAFLAVPPTLMDSPR